jgi:hypothetical protein
MTDRKWPDPKGTSPLHTADTGGSHLAHWPPPTMGQELKPMAVKHKSSEPVRRARRRGWRLTRAMFSEFAGEEE